MAWQVGRPCSVPTPSASPPSSLTCTSSSSSSSSPLFFSTPTDETTHSTNREDQEKEKDLRVNLLFPFSILPFPYPPAPRFCFLHFHPTHRIQLSVVDTPDTLSFFLYLTIRFDSALVACVFDGLLLALVIPKQPSLFFSPKGHRFAPASAFACRLFVESVSPSCFYARPVVDNRPS